MVQATHAARHARLQNRPRRGHSTASCFWPACRCGHRHEAAHEFDQLAGSERLGKAGFTRVEGTAVQPVEAAAGEDHLELRPPLMQSVGELKAAAPSAKVDVRHRKAWRASARQMLHRVFGRRSLDHVVALLLQAFHDQAANDGVVLNKDQPHCKAHVRFSYACESSCEAGAHPDFPPRDNTKLCCQHFAIVVCPISRYETEMILLPPGDADPEGKRPRYRAAGLKLLSKISRMWLGANHAALVESEGWLRAVPGSAIDDAVFTLDRHGQVTSWNTGAERLLGWTAAEIRGRDGAVLYTLAEREAGEPAADLQAAVAIGEARSERWVSRRDGTRVWATQTLTPLLG